jgi:nucleotide-binding universal stress UspA family protein
MKNQIKTILVPWDYTVLSEAALQYAEDIASTIESSITLLHITDGANSIGSSKEKLEKVAEDARVKYGIKPETVVRKGKVLKTIKKVAEHLDASLVIMKTAGITGNQRYFGSRALKIIAGSKIPFIVIQDVPKRGHIMDDVVIPIDFRWENKEKLNWIYFLHEYYESNIHLFRSSANDKRTENNLHFAKKTLDYKQIEFEITAAEGNRNFAIETIEYAHSIKADMIIIMLNRNLTFIDYILGPKEQHIIANQYKIPVMCLNPRNDLRKYAGFR